MARERGDSGQYVETVTLEAILDVFDDVARAEGFPVIGSRDVADALDCTTEAARQKLARLEDQGVVGNRKLGRTTAWYRTADAEALAEHKSEDGDD